MLQKKNKVSFFMEPKTVSQRCIFKNEPTKIYLTGQQLSLTIRLKQTFHKTQNSAKAACFFFFSHYTNVTRCVLFCTHTKKKCSCTLHYEYNGIFLFWPLYYCPTLFKNLKQCQSRIHCYLYYWVRI